MIRANVDRPLQTISPFLVITDDVLPFPDPEWEHLSVVYQILIRFQEIVPRCQMIDLAYVKMIMRQIGTRDEREQNSIAQVVVQFAVQARNLALSALSNAVMAELANWESSPNYMFAATVVLSITTVLVRECPHSLKFAATLVQGCVALLAAPCLLFFRAGLFNFISALLSADPTFTPKVLSAAIRFWPCMASSKQSFFIKLFTITLPKLSLRDHANLTPKVVAIVSEAIQSASTRVVEAALNFLGDRSMETFLANNLRRVLPAIFEALREAGSHHWNHEIRDLARKASGRLAAIDPRIYHEIAHTEGPWSERNTAKMQTWIQIAEAGPPNAKKCAEIRRIFASHDRPTGRRELKLTRRLSVAPRAMHLSELLPLLDDPTLLAARET
jgi:serine/threonine-protein phosphatase 2A regulatory subunit B'